MTATKPTDKPRYAADAMTPAERDAAMAAYRKKWPEPHCFDWTPNEERCPDHREINAD